MKKILKKIVEVLEYVLKVVRILRRIQSKKGQCERGEVEESTDEAGKDGTEGENDVLQE